MYAMPIKLKTSPSGPLMYHRLNILLAQYWKSKCRASLFSHKHSKKVSSAPPATHPYTKKAHRLKTITQHCPKIQGTKNSGPPWVA